MTVPRLVQVVAAVGVSAGLGACLMTPPQQRSIVNVPMTAPISAAPVDNVNTMGSIYQAGEPLLYETPRAQRIGDVLTIHLAESYSSNDSTNSTAKRTADMTAAAADPTNKAAARLAKLFNVGTGSSNFNANGNIVDTRGLTGTLAVTVIGTTPTGNLIIAGEKEISLKGNNERLRLSGIVNPRDVEAGNYVESNKVANARIEEAGSGSLNDHTTLGWLQRMFLSVMVF
jgi:flagellar L-ring protein FlgH